MRVRARARIRVGIALLGASEEEHVAADAHRRVARARPRIGARGVRLPRDGGRCKEIEGDLVR